MSIPKITVISDEFDGDLEKVLKFLKSKNLKFIELRDVAITNKVGKKRIGKFTDEELSYVKNLLNKYGFQVSALGSPLFNHNFPKNDNKRKQMLAELTRYVEIADYLQTEFIRVFSFQPFPKDISRNYDNDDSQFMKQFYQIVSFLKEASAIAAEKEKCIMLENEPNLFGATVKDNIRLMDAISSNSNTNLILTLKSIGILLDPGNMYRHKDDATLDELKKIYPITVYSHIKDVSKTFFGSRKYCVNGSKKALIPYTKIFSDMLNLGYDSFFSVETHMRGDKWNNSVNCLNGLINLLKSAGWNVSNFKN